MKPSVVALALVGLSPLIVTILIPPSPRLVWNVSASAPKGLYWVRVGARPKRGDMVIAHVPVRWRKLAARRHYIPLNVPLLKKVAAARGDQVCGEDRHLLVNDRPVAVRLVRDLRGRSLPWWQGCQTLAGNHLLLLMEGKYSFDGRYFGPTELSGVIGSAQLIWAA
jgi:conjugative transfer signal peptidase TraF